MKATSFFVEFDAPTYDNFLGLSKDLERIFGKKVEILTPEGLGSTRARSIAESIRKTLAYGGHADDLKRVQQLLHDIDQGVWKFCMSYNADRPLEIGQRKTLCFSSTEASPFPLSRDRAKPARPVSHASPDPPMAVTIGLLKRPWMTARTSSSVMGARVPLWRPHKGSREPILDYRRLLESASGLRESLCHICLDSSSSSLRVTIPASKGKRRFCR